MTLRARTVLAGLGVAAILTACGSSTPATPTNGPRAKGGPLVTTTTTSSTGTG